MPAVCVGDRLGQLADHAQPSAGVEAVTEAVEIVVQAHLVRPMAEDQRRARLVAFQPVDLDDPRMVDPVQDQELAAGDRLPVRPLGLPGGPFDEVDPHPASLGGDLGMGGVVVLPGRTGVERRKLQLPGADLLVTPAAGDPDRRQQRGQGLRQRRGDPLPLVAQRRVQQTRPDRRQRHAAATAATAPASPVGVPLGGAARGAALGAEDPVKLVVGELDPQGRVRQEDRRLDERDLRSARAAGVLQQGPQLLGLLVRQVQRVVEDPGVARVAVLGPVRPGRGQPADQALDLDEVDAAAGDDQQVDLADVPGGRGEGEVRPGAVRLGVRQQQPDVLQRLPLMRELRRRDRLPPAQYQELRF